MQDYHIYSHYVAEQGTPKTSPKYEAKPRKTVAVEKIVKETQHSKTRFSMTPLKAVGTGLMVANKINSYVGEYTENTITARKNQIGLTFAGLAVGMTVNPLLGGIAAVAYVANAGITYNIKQYKANLSANYLKDLSGGTVKNR